MPPPNGGRRAEFYIPRVRLSRANRLAEEFRTGIEGAERGTGVWNSRIKIAAGDGEGEKRRKRRRKKKKKGEESRCERKRATRVNSFTAESPTSSGVSEAARHGSTTSAHGFFQAIQRRT